jgi:spermidine/putrescine transport system ATP-binding protein
MAEKNFLQLLDISKTYQNGFTAVEKINFSVKKGEFLTLLGPSGCGKTTILKMIAGFEEPTNGRVLINGIDIKNLPINKRPTATVFQDYALFPNMTVYENITYGLKIMSVPEHGISNDKKKQAIKIYNDCKKHSIREIAKIKKEEEKLQVKIDKTKKMYEF